VAVYGVAWWFRRHDDAPIHEDRGIESVDD
jgi:hypothetical protein